MKKWWMKNQKAIDGILKIVAAIALLYSVIYHNAWNGFEAFVSAFVVILGVCYLWFGLENICGFFRERRIQRKLEKIRKK